MEIDKRPDKKFSKDLPGPCCSRRKGEQVNGFPCSLPEPGRQVGSLHRRKVGVYPGVGPDGWLRWFAHPLSGVVFKGHAQFLAFLQALQKWQLGGFGSFRILLFLICLNCNIVVVVQVLSCVWLFATPWTTALQASLSFTNSWNLLKLMSTESVLPFYHLVLCHPLLLLPSIFPSIRVFSNESAHRIRWPKYWNFSFSISPSNEYSGLISFRIDWFDLLAVQLQYAWVLFIPP